MIAWMGALAHGGSVSAMGEATAKPQKAEIHLYLKEEAGQADAKQRLKQTWDQAREWLISAGVTEDQMKLAEPISRPGIDQQKLLIQRVTITRPIKEDPAGEVLAIAKLIDQVGARGLAPASQLAVMGVELQDLFAIQEGDASNVLPFVVFLPEGADKLREQATQDAMAKLRGQIKSLSDVTGINEMKMVELSQVAQPAARDVPAVRGGTIDAVACRVHLAAEVRSAAAQPAQVLQVNVRGSTAVPVERAVIRHLLVCADKSLQRAAEELESQTRKLGETIQKMEGAKLEPAGVRLYSGIGPNGGLEGGMGGDGAMIFPAGACRWVSIGLTRGVAESEGDFRKRIEQLSAQVGGPQQPNPEMGVFNDGRTMTVWGPKDAGAYRNAAIKSALANAHTEAQRLAKAAGAKLGALVDASVNDTEDAVAWQMNAYGPVVHAGGPVATEGLVPLDQKLVLTIDLNARYAAELP